MSLIGFIDNSDSLLDDRIELIEIESREIIFFGRVLALVITIYKILI